jgi:hypothetical protein
MVALLDRAAVANRSSDSPAFCDNLLGFRLLMRPTDDAAALTIEAYEND